MFISFPFLVSYAKDKKLKVLGTLRRNSNKKQKKHFMDGGYQKDI